MSLNTPRFPSSSTLTRATLPPSLSKLNISPSSVPVPLDEPATQGITIQPPTAIPETSKLPQHPNERLIIHAAPPLDSIPSPQDTPLNRSPGLGSNNQISPSSRHPLTRQLSPDLPTRDALYLFSNFASYMRSPNEGAEGIVSNEDFKDTVRLLDYARGLVAQQDSNVRILHLKYRFQSPLATFSSTYATGDPQFPTLTRDGRGRLRNPVPQPFSVARDPVLKVDYQENGVFEPLPAQAIFNHISKACHPPPRLIVVSFVNSVVTQNHIAQLSTWALTSSPPCFVFSPLETRLRVTLPIHVALHHAIPMSMYAQPEQGPSPYKASPTRSIGGGGTEESGQSRQKNRNRKYHHNTPTLTGALRRRHSEQSLSQTTPLSARSYPNDPIASVTIISTPNPPQSRPSTSSGIPPTRSIEPEPNSSQPQMQSQTQPHSQAQSDRLPLWALAPGMNVSQGSTSASIGIKLGDFSALNLIQNDHEDIDSLGKALVGHRSRLNHHAGEVWIDSSPLRSKQTILIPPLMKPPSRPSTPASRIMDDCNSDTRSIRSVNTTTTTTTYMQQMTNRQQHLTPPDQQFTPPRLFSSNSSGQHQSFPRLARIPHWKRGRKELPEDVLEDLGKGLEVEGVLEGMRNLGMWDLEHSLHADRARRASEDKGGILLKSLTMGSASGSKKYTFTK